MTRTELLYREIGKCLVDNFDLLHFDAETILQTRTVAVLDEIRAIVQDESMDDFSAMEQIVCALEKYGIDAGIRHDF